MEFHVLIRLMEVDHKSAVCGDYQINKSESNSLCLVYCMVLDCNEALQSFLNSQAGEGASEEGCGADEAEGP